MSLFLCLHADLRLNKILCFTLLPCCMVNFGKRSVENQQGFLLSCWTEGICMTPITHKLPLPILLSFCREHMTKNSRIYVLLIRCTGERRIERKNGKPWTLRACQLTRYFEFWNQSGKKCNRAVRSNEIWRPNTKRLLRPETEVEVREPPRKEFYGAKRVRNGFHPELGFVFIS